MEIDVETQTPQIKNGAKISIGAGLSSIHFIVDHHFNWFQKIMIKWCYGFKVEDYDEE